MNLIVGLRAGNLYNVAISVLVFSTCFYTAWVIYFRGERSLSEKAYAFFLAALGVHWLGLSAGNLLAFWGEVSLVAQLGFPVKLISVFPPVALFYFLLTGLFEDRTLVRRGTFLYALVAIYYLFTPDLLKTSATYWGVVWQVGSNPRSLYLLGLMLPLLLLAGILSLRGNRLTLSLGAVVYTLLEYVQISTQSMTWQGLLLKLLYVFIVLSAYLYFSSRRAREGLVPWEKAISPLKLMRFPFSSRLLLLFVVLAILPITISSLLMFFSLKEVVDFYLRTPTASRPALLLGLNLVQVQSLFLTLIAGSLVMAMAILVSRSLSESLRTITEGLSRISRGDFSFKLIKTSNDEIGDVVDYFNGMAEEIKHSREKLTNWNQTLEAKVNEKTEDLRALYDISRSIGSTLDLNLLIERAVERLLPVLKVDAYALLTPSGDKFISRSSRNINLPEIKITEGRGLLGEALAGKAPLIAENLAGDPDLSKLDLKALLFTTLRAKGQTVGLLLLGSSKPHIFDKARDMNLMATLSDQLGGALENVGIYEKEKEAVARLTELDRMKNDFISMVSHELRTPVTSVENFVALMYEGTGGAVTDEQKKYLDIIKKNDQRLLNLIDRLIDFGKAESGRLTLARKLTSLHEVINSCLEEMKPLLDKKKAEVKLELSARDPKFMGDKDKMAEVFINLIENALKFSKEEEVLQITISTRDAGGFMEASVADNGIGIENQYLEKVFNKFFQIEESSTRKVGGVGLGLALVREIIGDHAGKVWAESLGLGKGSKFVFQIPVAEKA